MVTAREGPDVTVKVREEFNDDGVGRLRNEVALGDLELVFLERTRPGKELIAGARGENQEVGGMPFAIDTVAGFFSGGVHGNNVRAAYFATGFARTIEQQAVQNRARVNDDGMRHIERGTLLVAGDEFDGMNQLLGIAVFQQERKTLDGFVGETAATGLFPGEMFVKDLDGVPCARKLRSAHGTGWS